MNLKYFTAAFLLISLSGTASADYNYLKKHATLPGSVQKVKLHKKKAVLKLYPNPSSDGMVSVVSNMAGPVNFYIFDVEGTLLHQAVITENEKHTVTNLKKGIYTYDAFYNDEGIDHGQLIVK